LTLFAIAAPPRHEAADVAARTLALITMRRLPFSRLIWFGPGAKSSVATSLSGMNEVAAPLSRQGIGRRQRVGRRAGVPAPHDVEAAVALERCRPRGRRWRSPASCTSPMFRP
jgi:hypothetical protein